MGSEAAYFPDALARSTELGEALDQALDTPRRTQHEGLESPAPAIPELTDLTDEQLLKKVRDGEREALALLFRRHARAVRNVAYRILRNEAEADDMVQEVFLFIFRKAGLFDSALGAARPWIIHVAYHRAFDRRRYLNTRHFYSNKELDDSALRLADSGEEIPFHERSIEGVLGKVLTARFNARLTPEQQETIRYYFFEGYTLKEIAQLTGRSIVNVRSHFYRGLDRLRKYVLLEKLRSK